MALGCPRNFRGLDWAAKLIRKILRAPERPLEVTIVPSTGTPNLRRQAPLCQERRKRACSSFERRFAPLTHLGILDAMGIPPSIQGAVWSWPQAFRSLRVLVESSNQLAEEALVIRTLGSNELADAAVEAAQAISSLMQASQPSRSNQRKFVPWISSRKLSNPSKSSVGS